LKATDETTGEIVGWMGTVTPERSWGDHPFVAEEKETDSEQDRESWMGVDRKVHNGMLTLILLHPPSSQFVTLHPLHPF
jgi:hypothetical protein